MHALELGAIPRDDFLALFNYKGTRISDFRSYFPYREKYMMMYFRFALQQCRVSTLSVPCVIYVYFLTIVSTHYQKDRLLEL